MFALVRRLAESNSWQIIAALGLLTLVVLCLRVSAPNTLASFLHSVESPKVRRAASVLVVMTFVACAAISMGYPGYIDHVEPNVASVAWLALRGRPIYHEVDSPERYALLYGPMTYLPYSAALWFGRAAIMSTKAVVFGANVATVIFLWLSFRRLRPPPAGALALTLLLLLLARPNHYLFQVRGDALLTSGVAAGLYATCCGRWVGPILFAITAAFGSDVKFSGWLYFVPLFASLCAQRGRRAALTTAVGAALLGAAPFLLANVSFGSYMRWIRLGTRHPLSLTDFAGTTRVVAMLLAPLALILGMATPRGSGRIMRHLRENRARLLSLAICVFVVAALSSKRGAGAHHLLPFVPILAYDYALLWRSMGGEWGRGRPSAARYLVLCAITAAVIRVGGGLGETLSLWSKHWQWASRAAVDVLSVKRRYGAAIVEMGCGEGRSAPDYNGEREPVTFLRPLLVIASDRLTVDEAALNDMQLSGLELPRSTLETLGSCATGVWLIPRNEIPFSFQNIYALGDPKRFTASLFGPPFREIFNRHYALRERTEFFDLWICNRDRTGPATQD